MNLREALITQAPSLALQRAAADEIARLDASAAVEREARAMFAARLEHMSANNGGLLTVVAALALLNDCDMLASRPATNHTTKEN